MTETNNNLDTSDADETLLDLVVIQRRNREDNGEQMTFVELIRSQGFDPSEFGVGEACPDDGSDPLLHSDDDSALL